MAWILVAGLMGPATASTSFTPAIDREALGTDLATRSVLLDVARAGKRLVAVGEHGIVIFSNDHGHSWTQATVPVSVTLTGVDFVDTRQGWAAGHGGVVLRTTDGGETWAKQLDGIQAAKLALQHAKTRLRAWEAEHPDAVASSEQNEPGGPDDDGLSPPEQLDNRSPEKQRLDRAVGDAQWFVESGPDKPFFDVHFWDAKHGFVIGAFGLIFGTADGGETWRPWMDRMDNQTNNHLYDVRVIDGKTYVAGERGALFVTPDRGRSFDALKTPFNGTYFAIVPATDDGAALLLGLKGHFLRSGPTRANWRKVEKQVGNSAFDGLRTRNGAVVLAMEGGSLLVSRDDGENFTRVTPERSYPFAGLTQAADGALVVVGLGGVQRVPLSKLESANE